MMRLVVRDKQAGNVIDYVDTYDAGLKLIEQFEADDKADDCYEPEFYEIAEIEE